MLYAFFMATSFFYCFSLEKIKNPPSCFESFIVLAKLFDDFEMIVDSVLKISCSLQDVQMRHQHFS